MDRLDAIQMFVRVVDSGSFSAVARERSVGQPAVSKQIAALESHLGAQLLRRTSRSLSLTEAGQDFYESAVKLIGDLEAAQSRVGRGQSAPAGLVRATVAPAFGRLYVVPRLEDFFRDHPAISVEIIVSERSINLIEEGVDVAIHNGELSDSSLIARKIGATPIVTVATPAYLAKHGTPARPRDLESHACVIYSSRGGPRPWGFRDEAGSIIHHPTGPFRTNDAEQIRAAVLANLGLAHTPGWIFEAELASGAVCRVLPQFEPAELPIYVVHAGGRRLSTKVRAFIDFVADVFASESCLAIR